MATINNQSGIKYGQTVNMYTHICIECGVPFAIPDNLDSRLRQTKDSFYCPNGHSQHYIGKSEAEKVKEQANQEKKILEQKLKEAEYSKDYWNRLYKSKRQETITLKQQKTRITNRIKNGVCICCNRTFKDLAAHMKTQHPEHK